MAERILVLGGARSGKSAVAQGLVAGSGPVVYVATGGPGDAELAERVTAHRAARPAHWVTVETRDLAAAVRAAPAGSRVLVDALGPWLAERMTALGLWADAGAEVAPLGERGRAAADALVGEADAFWQAAADHPGGPVVLVADESGLGVTPPDPSSRRWLDLAGEVLQHLAATADRALLVVAGRPLPLPAAPGGPLAVPAPPAAPGVLAGAAASGPAAAGTGGAERPAVVSRPVARQVLRPAVAHRPVGRAAVEAAGPDEGAQVDLRAHGDRMVPAGAVDFAVNVWGEGPPAHLRAVLSAALEEVGRYPDLGTARAAVARRHGRDEGEVLVAAGAAEVFRLLPAALGVRRAAIVHPQFTEPEAALRAAGVPVVHVARDPRDGWVLDPAAVPEDADLVVLGNPNNPTGTLDPPEQVVRLCRPGRLVVVDEAFVDFVADPAASLAGRTDLPGLVVVRSVTKLWALPGLRAGYALAAAGLVRRLAAVRQPWPVSGPAAAALAACCEDEAHRLAVAAQVADARADLRARLAALPGVTVWPSAANFVLVRVPDGPAVDRALRARGVAVRPSTFPTLSADHLRIAVRDPARHILLATALQDVLASAPPTGGGRLPERWPSGRGRPAAAAPPAAGGGPAARPAGGAPRTGGWAGAPTRSAAAAPASRAARAGARDAGGDAADPSGGEG